MTNDIIQIIKKYQHLKCFCGKNLINISKNSTNDFIILDAHDEDCNGYIRLNIDTLCKKSENIFIGYYYKKDSYINIVQRDNNLALYINNIFGIKKQTFVVNNFIIWTLDNLPTTPQEFKDVVKLKLDIIRLLT